MTDSNKWKPEKAWYRLRIEAKAAENYPLSYSLYINQTHRDKLLEQLLPSLLYIKAVSILDDSLGIWLSDNNIKLSKPYFDNLNGRISYLDDNNIIKNASELHRIRKNRNLLAHEPETNCEWNKLNEDINHIEDCLVSLGLARVTGKLEYFAERSAMEWNNEPGITGSRNFKYGVKDQGRVSFQISWTQKFHDD